MSIKAGIRVVFVLLACVLPNTALAQSTAPVTLIIEKGPKTKQYAITSVEWRGDTLTLFGPKEANGAHRYYCILNSKDHSVLLQLAEHIAGATSETFAKCKVGIVSTDYVRVDLQAQTSSTYFGLSVKR